MVQYIIRFDFSMTQSSPPPPPPPPPPQHAAVVTLARDGRMDNDDGREQTLSTTDVDVYVEAKKR